MAINLDNFKFKTDDRKAGFKPSELGIAKVRMANGEVEKFEMNRAYRRKFIREQTYKRI